MDKHAEADDDVKILLAAQDRAVQVMQTAQGKAEAVMQTAQDKAEGVLQAAQDKARGRSFARCIQYGPYLCLIRRMKDR